jgi:hypothetical protein
VHVEEIQSSLRKPEKLLSHLRSVYINLHSMSVRGVKYFSNAVTRQLCSAVRTSLHRVASLHSTHA